MNTYLIVLEKTYRRKMYIDAETKEKAIERIKKLYKGELINTDELDLDEVKIYSEEEINWNKK